GPARALPRAVPPQPELTAFLDEQGEPDTIDVVGARLEPKRLVLTYRRDDAGRPRRIVLEPSRDGYVASAPEFLRSERVARRAEPAEQARNAGEPPAVVDPP